MPAAIAIPLIIGAATAGTSIASGVMGANAAQNAAKSQASAAVYAADKQAASAKDSLDFQKQVFSTDQTNLAPYLAQGKVSLAQLGQGTAPGGEFVSSPTSDQVLAQDPGYDFRLAEGQKALQRAEAAGGGVASGGALKAAAQYGQDYASGEYANAYSRFMENRQANFSNLASLAGVGQTASSQIATAGQGASTNIANINTTSANLQGQDLMAAGNATASGYVGSTNAMTGALGNVGNIASSTLATIAKAKGWLP